MTKTDKLKEGAGFMAVTVTAGVETDTDVDSRKL